MKIIIICLFVIASYHVKSQKHYSSIQEGSKYSLEQIASAINHANWCGYFHETENYEIRFDDGSFVTLKNKSQIQASGDETYMDPKCFQNVLTKSEYVHIINSSGWIMVPKEKVVSKSKSK